jgi:hypothetical protein
VVYIKVGSPNYNLTEYITIGNKNDQQGMSFLHINWIYEKKHQVLTWQSPLGDLHQCSCLHLLANRL